jgi:hypothetical protein
MHSRLVLPCDHRWPIACSTHSPWRRATPPPSADTEITLPKIVDAQLFPTSLHPTCVRRARMRFGGLSRRVNTHPASYWQCEFAGLRLATVRSARVKWRQSLPTVGVKTEELCTCYDGSARVTQGIEYQFPKQQRQWYGDERSQEPENPERFDARQALTGKKCPPSRTEASGAPTGG